MKYIKINVDISLKTFLGESEQEAKQRLLEYLVNFQNYNGVSVKPDILSINVTGN